MNDSNGDLVIESDQCVLDRYSAASKQQEAMAKPTSLLSLSTATMEKVMNVELVYAINGVRCGRPDLRRTFGTACSAVQRTASSSESDTIITPFK